MIKLGDEGLETKNLIKDLRKLGFELPEGDKYNQSVKKSIETFQSANQDSSGTPLIVDGKVGPHTRWALDVALGKKSPIQMVSNYPAQLISQKGGSARGQAALQIAKQEIGCGETIKDNYGPDIERYFGKPDQQGNSWCAAFVSYCFHQPDGKDAVFGYQTGAQAIHNTMKTLGYAYQASLSEPPQPGDIICWLRIDPNNPKATNWMGHVGIVHSYSDGTLWTIEGNRGPFPSKVKLFSYSWSVLVASASNDKFKGLYGLSRHP